MRGFDDVSLSWNGETKNVPATEVFELVMRVENALHDGGKEPVFMRLMRRDYAVSHLAKGYAAALSCAGFSVTAADIYLHIESGMADGDVERIGAIHNATVALLSIVAPNIYDVTFGGNAESSDEKK